MAHKYIHIYINIFASVWLAAHKLPAGDESTELVNYTKPYYMYAMDINLLPINCTLESVNYTKSYNMYATDINFLPINCTLESICMIANTETGIGGGIPNVHKAYRLI